MRVDLRKPGRRGDIRLVMSLAVYCPGCAEHLGDLPDAAPPLRIAHEAERMAATHEPTCPRKRCTCGGYPDCCVCDN